MRGMLSLLVGVLLLSQIGSTQERQAVVQTSFLRLVVLPEKFEGQTVSVEGFLSLGRERDVLFAHEDDSVHLILSNGVLVDRTEQMGKQMRSLNNKYVRIVGTFRTGGGHVLPFAGTITEIRKCELWSDPAVPVTKRLREMQNSGATAQESNRP